MKRKWAIFDLDNCVSNDEWRIPRIAWHHSDPDLRYHDYHSLAAFDAPANMHIFRPLARTDGVGVAIFTARPETFRAATAHWLDVQRMRFDVLLMRPRGDHRPSVQLKAVQLATLRAQHELHPADDIVAAFDDRRDVVEMYLRQGVGRAAQLAIHDTCAYTAPTTTGAVAK